jgi:calcium permeable stress-gated cation channel
VVLIFAGSVFTRFDGHVSMSGTRLVTFKAIFFTLTIIAGIWLMAVGAVLFAVESFQSRRNVTKTIANGSIIMTAFALALISNVAIVSPGLLLLQPYRLWKVIRAEKSAITPRQRFRGEYARDMTWYPR